MGGPCYYSGSINIAKNEDWIVPFQYGTDNGSGGLNPIDLTGSTIKMEIRKRETDREVQISVYSPANGITISDPVNGLFTILLDRPRLSQLQAGDYTSDIVRLMTNGWQERLWAGDVTVVEGTTR
jgi:hypothetical protein